MGEKAFSFLPMPERSSKPRKFGLTMCLDQGMGLNHTEDLLSICSEYVDIWKLGWATAQLQPKEIVRKKVEILRSNGISVCNGGTLLELSEHQGKVKQLFTELLDLGCDATEISSGSLDINSNRIVELISIASAMGLKVFCEVGKKLPEDDYGGLEYNRLLKKFIEAGADKVILEARESGASVGIMDDQGEPKESKMSDVLEGVDPTNVIFEAPRKPQQIFFLRQFGSEANL